VDATIPPVVDWYSNNELGDKRGNPRVDQTCAEYNPRREFTTMFRIRVDEPLPSPGTMYGMGRASVQFGRADVNQNGAWSWMVYPRQHPNGENILVDLLLRNATHEVGCTIYTPPPPRFAPRAHANSLGALKGRSLSSFAADSVVHFLSPLPVLSSAERRFRCAR
jgi:hypothetical protein